MKKHIQSIILPCSLFFALCSLIYLSACSQEKSKQPMSFPPAPVTVAVATTRSVPVYIQAIGNVEPYSTVAIRSRVGGELLHVNFREGQDVKKGDLLFKIDPRTYETALESAQAALARDTALAKKAERDVTRYTELFKDQLVSRDDYDRITTEAEALKATLMADASAVENARLLLEYCSITAPVSGRTGSLLVDRGNIIKANDENPMVVINQIQPVYVSFSIPESTLPEIKRYMASGKISVEAFASRQDMAPEKGTLTFLDNAVDTATGTIRLKATFENRERALWPGQFITVRITLATIQDAVVVPSQAVQTGQQGQFVFVVKDGTAELRPVNAGVAHNDITVIEKGVTTGEQVVTDGQIRIMPGAKVEIKNKDSK